MLLHMGYLELTINHLFCCILLVFFLHAMSLNIFQDTGEIITLKVKSKHEGYSTVNDQRALLVLTVHKKHFHANL